MVLLECVQIKDFGRLEDLHQHDSVDPTARVVRGTVRYNPYQIPSSVDWHVERSRESSGSHTNTLES